MQINDLIPGIFNYCDRWCERCVYSNRCLVFQKESEQKIKHILKDEDPDDPTIFAQDIADNFREALETLNKMMEGMDDKIHLDEAADLDDDFEKIIEPNMKMFDLHTKSNDFFKECSIFIKKIETHLSNQNDEFMRENKEQKLLAEVVAVLSWYSPQILVKCKRANFSLKEMNLAVDEEMRGYATEDLNVTLKIAYLGIKKCLQVLTDLYNHMNEFSDEIIELLVIGSNTEKELLKLFPEIPSYKRPYFD
ncbi:MAG: hypothetical protein Q8N83_11115 [Ignavibacteria bacterium]|nr:hypothetical protein [Ignavibacteria bacterium]